MGYDGKRGLGTHGQGRVDLVEESKQKGRKGLGFSYTGFSDASSQWDFENDPVCILPISISLILVFLTK